MTEDVALAILSNGVAQVSSHHEIGSSRDLNGPSLNREALEDVEARSVQDLVTERQERGLERDGEVDGGLAVRTAVRVISSQPRLSELRRADSPSQSPHEAYH